MARTNREFKYHAALSFAGEAREVAERIFREASKRGLMLFYDKDNTAQLWGRDHKELENVYSTETRYVIPIISKSYPKKDCDLLPEN